MVAKQVKTFRHEQQRPLASAAFGDRDPVEKRLRIGMNSLAIATHESIPPNPQKCDREKRASFIDR